MKDNVKVIKSENLSNSYEDRFVIVDAETEEVLDSAQGYGYKTIQKAYAAWAWKHRDVEQETKKNKQISAWMKQHKPFVELMDTFAFEIAKGSWGPEDKFDAKFVAEMLKENNLEIDFSIKDLLRVWRNRK